MSSVSIITNKFDGNDYRISIIPVHKRISIPSVLDGIADGMKFEPEEFNNIILEAAIYTKNKFFKPLFVIELDDGYSIKTTKDEFTKFINHIVANERIDSLMNFEVSLDTSYGKYGFIAMKHDVWSLFFLSRVKTVIIFKNPQI